MLKRLEINNFAVISHAILEPTTGFNVISGETGAGKSLLIDAVDLILGSKASKNLIRNDADEAFVEAVFDISNHKDKAFLDILDESGITYEDDIIIISRKVSKDGKSIARINGRTVVLALLRNISSYLVDIHGQHDTQKIFDDSTHVNMLDNYGGAEVISCKDNYRALLNEYKSIVLEIRRINSMPESMDKQKEFLESAIKEIRDCNFYDGEEDDLITKRNKYRLIKKQSEYLSEMDNLLNNDDSNGMNIADRVATCLKTASKLKDADESYSDLYERLDGVLASFEAVANEISDIASSSEYDPIDANMVDERLGKLMDLKSKYGSTIVDINNYAFKAEDELKNLSDSKVRLSELKKQRVECEKKLIEAGESLTNIRRIKGEMLSSAITNELRDLEIPNSSFHVEFTRRSKDRFFSNDGIDNVTFMFSANPGEPPRNLAHTASGGEASRIMLAIKNILSECDTVPTLVFDEIDTGVSGKSSIAIANKLKSISSKHQVLCVTHTAQLAAAANSNYLIAKAVSDGVTSTSISCLDGEAKIKEVSRLLSGTNVTKSLDLAKQLCDIFM
ncbi:MAG: DNA repair protein RecN [Saccharofermentans sp.]|nr:DNA repair protein RecN [Saccharofermentans sp.]